MAAPLLILAVDGPLAGTYYQGSEDSRHYAIEPDPSPGRISGFNRWEYVTRQVKRKSGSVDWVGVSVYRERYELGIDLEFHLVDEGRTNTHRTSIPTLT